MKNDPILSVVIPTHNRQGLLLRTLSALARQRDDSPPFEVVVSVDGSRDDTIAVLDALATPYPLRVVSSPLPRGAAAARNSGALTATAPVIVFLDDDVEPSPGLLAAHAATQGAGAAVTTGYLPPTTAHVIDFFQIALRGWWEAMFDTMRQSGHRYTFRDVLTGNCSVNRTLFERLGGFDEQFRCHEDYEFGVRAIEADADVRFVEEANAIHHERTRLERSFARKVDEGRADVVMVRKHPHLFPTLPMGVFDRHATRTQALLRRLVFERPQAARLMARTFTRSLRPLEAARLRGRWRRRLYDLLDYCYWRGVVDAVGSFEAFAGLAADGTSEPRWVERMDVDLAGGIVAAMHGVDARRPHAVSIRYGREPVGVIEWTPGSERLRAVHLKAALAGELAGPLISALGRAGRIGVERRDGKITASHPLPTEALRLAGEP